MVTRMQQKQIVSINDGDISDPIVVKEYGIEQLCTNGKYDFVGFINKNNKILIACPKHYEFRDSSDIKLIVRCIIKSFRKTDKGSTEAISCNIPLRPYLHVLDYYYKHGIFRHISSDYRLGYGGNIDWNRTIRKSPKVVSGGNLLFLPFDIKHVKSENSFISECMTYVINDGFEQFGKYAGIGIRIDTDGFKYSFRNTESVMRQLKAEEGRYFKDSEIQLIRALISYFAWEGSVTEQSYFITQSFEWSWESMIHNYLNLNFAGSDY